MSKQLNPALYFVHASTSTVEVRFDPHAKKINVIEGSFSIQGLTSNSTTSSVLVDISTEGSVLTMWPIVPYFSAEESIVSFNGGVPLGFDEEGLLFSMNFPSYDVMATSISNASTSLVVFSPNDISITWLDGGAYLNDGKGTKQTIFVDTNIRSADGQGVDTGFSGGAILIGLLIVVVVAALIAFRYAHTKHIAK